MMRGAAQSPGSAVLPEDADVRYRQLTGRYGSPLFLRPPSESIMPLRAAAPTLGMDLASAATCAQLAAQLATFDPPADPHDLLSSTFETAGQLRTIVAAQAEVYSADAPELAVLDEPNLSAAICGLGDGVRRGQALEWAAILQLADQVIAAPDRTTAAREVMTLLADAAERSALPPQDAEHIWQIIAAVLERGPAGLDAAAHADLRALAVNTAAAYALWARQAGADPLPAITVLTGLDPAAEADPVAAALGSNLWLLTAIGAEGTKEHLAALLIPGTPVFTGYLTTGVHLPTAAAHHQVYRAAIGAGLPGRDHELLGAHLLLMYWHGQIGLEHDGLMDVWWQHSNTTARAAEQLAHGLVRLVADLAPARGLRRAPGSRRSWIGVWRRCPSPARYRCWRRSASCGRWERGCCAPGHRPQR